MDNPQEHFFKYIKLDDMWWNVCIHCGIVDRTKDLIECDPSHKLSDKSGMDRHWRVMEKLYNRFWNHDRLIPRSEWRPNDPYYTCTNCNTSNFNNGYYGNMVCVQCRHDNSFSLPGIPNSINILKMNCIMCENELSHPTNLIKHLGVNQTEKYLQFCNETGTKPSLYCCSCYQLVERNPNWQKAMDEMIDNAIKYHELKKNYQEKVLNV